MYDIIIVGAGPAGLTAAIYARRASKSVLVLEALSYGGQIINTPEVENYPAVPHISGFDLATKMYGQAAELGAEIKFEKVTGIRSGESDKAVITGEGEYACKAIIIATGSKNRKLGIEGEDGLVGRGISYCATCDGAFYRGKTAAVAGGGNTAVEDALYLADLAKKVYLIHRRDTFRADAAAVEALSGRDNIELVLNSTVTRLISDKKLTGIEVTDTVTGAVRQIELDGLFTAIGRVPENGQFSPPVELDSAGYIIAGEDCRTNVPGIFAAGDNRTKELRQLVTAASDGAVAASGAIKYISETA